MSALVVLRTEWLGVVGGDGKLSCSYICRFPEAVYPHGKVVTSNTVENN